MGEDLPTEWPVLEADKWYCVVLDTYSAVFGCFGPDPVRVQCCLLGALINGWIAADMECTDDPLCVIGPNQPQRIINIFGPYMNQAACIAACV